MKTDSQCDVWGRRSSPREEIGDADYVCTDLTTVEPDDAVFEGVGMIAHLASTTVPATSMTDMIYDSTSNIAMSLRLLEAAAKRGIRRFVFASSGGTVYGHPSRLPAKENDPTYPISSYGVVKLAIENYVRMEANRHGFLGVNMRVANPYGPGQFRGTEVGVIVRFLKQIAEGQPIHILGDGSIRRDFLHVDDAVDAIRLALDPNNNLHGTYNVGSGSSHSINEVVTTVEEITGLSAEVNYEPSRGIDVPSICLSTEKLTECTGWTTSIPLKIGIGELWDELLGVVEPVRKHA